MNKEDKRRKEIQAKEKRLNELYAEIQKVQQEKQKLEQGGIVDYTGKLLHIRDDRKSWYADIYIKVVSQGAPEVSGIYRLSGHYIQIKRNSDHTLFSVEMPQPGGGIWVSKSCTINEITKEEVIKITSNLGTEFWDDKI